MSRLNWLVAGEDVATAAFGMLNAGYFADYWWRRDGSRARRVGAASLVLLSLAAVAEALFSQGLFWWQGGVVGLGQLSTGMWAVARIPLLVATAAVSAIIARRLAG